MKTSIFIVSYARDADWLPYLLKSINKFCTGFHEVVILVPEQDLHVFQRFGLTVEKLKSFSEAGFACGFMAHQYAKCCADQWCEGDFIVHVDSDCVFTAPTTPYDYLFPPNAPENEEEVQAINLCTPYASLNGGSPWQPGTEMILGEPCPFETMRRHPSVYPRGLYPALHQHVSAKHQRPLADLIRPMPRTGPFSEFNVMGSFGKAHMSWAFHWIDTSTQPEPVNTLHQMWSWHRPNHPDVKQKLFEFGLL